MQSNVQTSEERKALSAWTVLFPPHGWKQGGASANKSLALKLPVPVTVGTFHGCVALLRPF